MNLTCTFPHATASPWAMLGIGCTNRARAFVVLHYESLIWHKNGPVVS